MQVPIIITKALCEMVIRFQLEPDWMKNCWHPIGQINSKIFLDESLKF
jgi:hypothetical protein